MSDLIYDLSFPLPDTPEDGLTLIVAMHGYADAGQAVDGVSRHLLGALNHSTLATFDIDALMDYRSRRPPVHLEGTRVYLSDHTGSDNAKLTLSEVSDNNGRPFLLLSGPEPDLQWRTFATAVTDLARKFRVQRTICIYSAPMPVPHTRPLIVTQHGAHIPEPDSFAHFDGIITVPGSAALHLEIEMAGSGIETTGLTAHVPHYIAGSEYPRAMAELISGVEKVASVDLPVRALEHAADRIAEQLQEQVDDSPEIAQVVAALEHQYDNELSRLRQRQEDQAELEKLRNNIPTGEEIGREFELYLRSLDDKDDSSPNAGGTEGADAEDGGAEEAVIAKDGVAQEAGAATGVPESPLANAADTDEAVAEDGVAQEAGADSPIRDISGAASQDAAGTRAADSSNPATSREDAQSATSRGDAQSAASDASAVSDSPATARDDEEPYWEYVDGSVLITNRNLSENTPNSGTPAGASTGRHHAEPDAVDPHPEATLHSANAASHASSETAGSQTAASAAEPEGTTADAAPTSTSTGSAAVGSEGSAAAGNHGDAAPNNRGGTAAASEGDAVSSNRRSASAASEGDAVSGNADSGDAPASAPKISRKAGGDHPSTGGFWGRLWRR